MDAGILQASASTPERNVAIAMKFSGTHGGSVRDDSCELKAEPMKHKALNESGEGMAGRRFDMVSMMC